MAAWQGWRLQSEGKPVSGGGRTSVAGVFGIWDKLVFTNVWRGRYWRLHGEGEPAAGGGRIFVEGADGGAWRLLAKPEQLEGLMGALERRGPREGALALALSQRRADILAGMPAPPLRCGRPHRGARPREWPKCFTYQSKRSPDCQQSPWSLWRLGWLPGLQLCA